MCDKAKLEQWAMDRRQFGALAGSALVVACAPGEVTETEEVLTTAGPWSDLAESTVSFATEAGTMDAFFVHPKEGSFPGVIFWPDIASIRESKREMARRLAEYGYSVLVLNPYYRDVEGEQFTDFAAFIDAEGFSKVRPWREKLTADAIGADANAAAAWLDAQESVDATRGIGTQGYCMGGPFTVWSAAAVPSRIKAAASFHGGGLVREDNPLSPHRVLDRTATDAAFLIAVAQDDDAEDPQAKETFAEAAEEAGRNAKIEVFGGDHGWTVPDSPAYEVLPAEQAFADLLQLYEGNL